MEHKNGGLVQIIVLFNWVMFRFHVKFQGCNRNLWLKFPTQWKVDQGAEIFKDGKSLNPQNPKSGNVHF